MRLPSISVPKSKVFRRSAIVVSVLLLVFAGVAIGEALKTNNKAVLDTQPSSSTSKSATSKQSTVSTNQQPAVTPTSTNSPPPSTSSKSTTSTTQEVTSTP